MQSYFDYMKKAILETIEASTDEKMLQFIYTMLMASITEADQEASE